MGCVFGNAYAGTFVDAYSTKTIPVDADTININDSADINGVTGHRNVKNITLDAFRTYAFGDSVLFSVTAPLAFNSSTGVMSLDGNGCTPGQGIVWGGTSFACGTVGGGGSQTITISTSAPTGGVANDIW